MNTATKAKIKRLVYSSVKRRVDVPTTTYPPESNAGDVLDDIVSHGKPVLLMGNTVHPFMRDMEGVISERAVALSGGHYDDDVDTLDEVPPK